jgi:exodeoxyribonuclease VII large subunit
MGRLEGLSPMAVLGRGYAVAWDETGTRILRSVDTVTIGDHVRVTLQQGELRCVVTETRQPETQN